VVVGQQAHGLGNAAGGVAIVAGVGAGFADVQPNRPERDASVIAGQVKRTGQGKGDSQSIGRSFDRSIKQPNGRTRAALSLHRSAIGLGSRVRRADSCVLSEDDLWSISAARPAYWVEQVTTSGSRHGRILLLLAAFSLLDRIAWSEQSKQTRETGKYSESHGKRAREKVGRAATHSLTGSRVASGTQQPPPAPTALSPFPFPSARSFLPSFLPSFEVLFEPHLPSAVPALERHDVPFPSPLFFLSHIQMPLSLSCSPPSLLFIWWRSHASPQFSSPFFDCH